MSYNGDQYVDRNLEVRGKTVLNAEVGIGIHTPEQMVHIEHPTLDSVVRIGAPSNKTSAIQIYSHAGAYTWQMGVPFNADRFVIDEASISAGNDLVIKSGGNVGIGTTSPDDALHVKGNIFIEDASPEITFETGAGKYNWQIAAQENTDQAFEIGLGSADDDASNDTFSPKLTIEYSGDVGIGVTNPAHKIDVVGTAGLSTGTAWTNTSDVRIKTNVETVTGGLDKIYQLRPVSFNYISDYTDIHQEIDASKKYNSFIANEYAEVFPDAVSVGGNLERITPSSDIGEPNEVEVLIEDLLQFTPHDLHVYLVKAVQELSAKVTVLENN